MRFEVSVQNPVFVTERSTLEKLVHETPNGDGIEGATLAVDIHVFLEVAFTVLKYEDELCLGVDDVVEADDIDMLELFHEGDLTDGGRWGAFFCIEMNLLEGDDFVCRS